MCVVSFEEEKDIMLICQIFVSDNIPSVSNNDPNPDSVDSLLDISPDLLFDPLSG